MVYYNEFDEPTAWWLKGLSDNGVIPKGFVDTRSIVDVDPDELKQYTQCHFFAGIGGWAYALMLANVREDVSVYTGSCPCQPYSLAGKQKGNEDDRNLWPYFYRIIDENKPSVVIGEQVASAIKFGWLDQVENDLEESGYATGAAVLTSSMLGAPHTRRRLYWGGGYVQKFWGTPTVSDIHGGCRWALKEGALDNFHHTIKNEYLAANAFGNTERGKKVQMGSPLCLNPEISRWLMGFPIDFSNIADMVMPLFRK